MRTANVLTGASLALWLALFYVGRTGTYNVYAQGKDVYPNSGQIDYYIVFPMCVAIALAVAGWIFNVFRSPLPLKAISIISFMVLLPYLFAYTGGM